ncbi:MAG: tetratricopeptide repeat protein [Spirochaetota bacterium]
MERIFSFIKYLLRISVAGGLELFVLGIIFCASIVMFLLIIYITRRIHPLRKAERFRESGNLEKALFFIALAIRKNPFNRGALRLRAEIEVQLEQFSEAARDYFKLLYLKTPGDGVDIFEVKQNLLLPLYHSGHLIELYTLCQELLKREKENPHALYYLSLIYIGQRYYREAAKYLEILVRNRPVFHEGLFAYAVSVLQEKRFDEAYKYITKALEVKDNILYRLCKAAMLYFTGNFIDCAAILDTLPGSSSRFDNKKQYLFALKLGALCFLKRGEYIRAVELFRKRYEALQEKGDSKTQGLTASKLGIYDERGKIRFSNDAEKKEKKQSKPSPFEEYFRLKEVALEEGVVSPGFAAFPPQKRILDLEGFSLLTEAGIDLVFSMIKGGLIDEAITFLRMLRKNHPELLGAGKLVDMVAEKKEQTRKTAAGSQVNTEKLRESTERIIKKKKRRYELWEYLEEWERNAVKPYELLIVASLTSTRRLDPSVLFSKKAGV